MEKWKGMIDQFWFVLPFAVWAAVGFIAHTLQTGWPGWKTWLSQLVAACIAGMIMGMLLQNTGMDDYMVNGIVACTGMSGGKLVEDIAKWTRRRAEKIITGENGSEQ